MERGVPQGGHAVVLDGVSLPDGQGSQGDQGFSDVLQLVRDELRPASWRAYSAALATLAAFLDHPSAATALAYLVRLGPVAAHRNAHAWVAAMEARGLSAATRALRIAALHRAWSVLQRLGIVLWPLRVKAPRPTPLRDTRGPELAAARALFDAARASGGVRGARDVALLALLLTLALRRGEIARLDVDDFDRAGGRLRVRGKGRDDWEWLAIPQPAAGALARYLDVRDAMSGEPLIANVCRSNRGGAARLSEGGIYRVVRALAARADIGVPVSPHRLRHSAITTALDGTGGDVRRVRAFSRHAKLETVIVYDDRRTDLGGEIATLVATAIGADRLSVEVTPDMPAGMPGCPGPAGMPAGTPDGSGERRATKGPIMGVFEPIAPSGSGPRDDERGGTR